MCCTVRGGSDRGNDVLLQLFQCSREVKPTQVKSRRGKVKVKEEKEREGGQKRRRERGTEFGGRVTAGDRLQHFQRCTWSRTKK